MSDYFSIILFILLTCVTNVQTLISPACDPGWTYEETLGNCFKFFKTIWTAYDQARSGCRENGADIAFPKTPETNEVLRNINDYMVR